VFRALTDLLDICKDRDNVEYTLKVRRFRLRTFSIRFVFRSIARPYFKIFPVTSRHEVMKIGVLNRPLSVDARFPIG